jgi:DNA-binding MarR family transcriptional regulator
MVILSNEILVPKDAGDKTCLDNKCYSNKCLGMTPPNVLEAHLGYWLRKLSNQVSSAFAARVEKYGVSVAGWVVLRVLFDHDSLPLKDIVSQVGVDQGALSRMVERLMVRGLVIRKESPNSRREVAISLTEAGRKLVPKLAREADENDRTHFDHLSARQRTELLSTIKTLMDHAPYA